MKNNKVIIIIMGVIIVLLIAVVVFLLVRDNNEVNNDNNQVVTDATKFAEEYTLVPDDNVFVYSSVDEIIDILENGAELFIWDFLNVNGVVNMLFI